MDGCPLIAEDAARDRRAALGEPTQGARDACRSARPALPDILNASDTDAAIVGTRSALIMIKNLLALGEQFSYDRYEPFLEARLEPAHPATITLPSGLTKSTLPGHPTDADLVGEERSVV